jgi:GT2 family glycosyltransferase/SAM-dependent methyltransferase
MSELIHCALCRAEGLFFRSFGKHRLYRCTSCQSLFYSPFPTEDRKRESPWESAKWYVERGANLLFYAEVLATVRRTLESVSPQKEAKKVVMLEVGGNYGFLLDMASVLFRWDVSGADPSPCALQGARELGISILNTTIEKAQFDKKFDAIIGVQLIEHIEKPRVLIAKLSELVREEGFVVLTTPDASVSDLGAEYSPGDHHILFSQKGLASLLADAGFTYYRFFSTTVPTIMGVVAAKTSLPESILMPESFKTPATAKQMILEYLMNRIQLVSNNNSLRSGLLFRLFELLVNEGRYAEADAHVRSLETCMGMDSHESSYSFANRLVERMTATSTPEDYVAAGPGCVAPYFFFKGILKLNYKRDRAAAGHYFSSASELFEHEVRRLSLIQYEPWLTVARKHMGITGVSPRKDTREEHDNIFRDVCTVEAAPFIRGGILEFCDNVPVGRLLRIGVRRRHSFIYTFTSMKENLSGISFDLLIRPYRKREPVKVTLQLFEEYNPVALRKTSCVVEFASWDKLQRITEPFRFKPIRDSQGRNYSIVLSIGNGSKKASLLCTTFKGDTVVTGDRQYKNTRPVTIPYHYDTLELQEHLLDSQAPLVSCLIVTHNSGNYIKRCLNSIFQQDYPNIEVVVVDNHSDDHTVEIIRKEFGHVQLFVIEENLEFSKGNNFGIAKCKGNFICILNADIVLEQGAIRRLVEHVEISPFVAAVGSTIETRGSSTWYADTFIINGLICNDEKLLAGTCFSSAPCGTCFMIRRSVADTLGYLFDEGFVSNWEDHDLGLRCWLHGYIVLHIADSLVYHYGASTHGLANPRRESQVFRNMLLTYFKNFGKRLFVKAFFKTLTTCTRPYRIVGLVRFLGSFWKYIPERAALQKKRKIDDSALQVITSGFRAIIAEDETEKDPDHD